MMYFISVTQSASITAVLEVELVSRAVPMGKEKVEDQHLRYIAK
jgi:hypothetical protein